MENLSLFYTLQHSLDTALGLAKFSVATTFGISFLANAFFAIKSTQPNSSGLSDISASADTPMEHNSKHKLRWIALSKLLPQISRIAFLLGMLSLACFCTIVALHPAARVETLVLLGVALVLAVVTFLWETSAKAIPTLAFLSSGIVWLLAIGGAYFLSFYSENAQTFAQKPLDGLSSFHIGTATIGSGLCVMSFLAALLYLLSFHWLKAKKLGGVPTLPSLEFLDRLIEKSTLWGLFSMTFSLVSGLGLAFVWNPPQQVTTLKIVWAFAVWGFYAISIYGRGFWGWRGRAGALLALWGVLLIGGTLFGTAFGTIFDSKIDSDLH